MSTLSDAYATIWDGQLACYDSETLTIDSTDYPCFGTDLTDANSLVPGGLLDEPDAAVSVKRSLFSTLPALQAVAAYRDKSWKIDRIRSGPNDSVVTFELKVNFHDEEAEMAGEGPILVDQDWNIIADQDSAGIISPPAPGEAILDQTGGPILDESGNPILGP
jgi:hypothetical protein